MQKIFLLGFFLLLCIGFGFAEGFEKNFALRGFEDFVVEGANETECFSVPFLKQEQENLFPIVSLLAEFLPVREGKAGITVKVNGETIEELKPGDFKCTQECVARVMLERDKLKEENELELCISTGNTINKIVLSNKSAIGFYLTPVFLQGDFTKSASKTKLYPEEIIEVTISIHNSGSASALLDLNFVTPFVEERMGYIEVIGDTYFSDVELEAAERQEFIYHVKPKKPILMSLPAAILKYENVFGDFEEIRSNAVHLIVEEIEEKLSGRVFAEKNVFKLGETGRVKVSVSNLSESKAVNAEVFLNLEDDLLVEGNNKEGFEILPKETKFFEFVVSAENAGEFSVGCRIKYNDFNTVESYCEEITLVFEEEKNSLWLVVGALFLLGIVLVGGILYYAYWHRKEE